MSTSNAFKGDDSVKSRADLIYERNTHRRQASVLRESRDMASEAYNTARLNLIKWTEIALRESEDKEPLKKMLWKYYASYPTVERVFTEKSTGEKTVKGKSTVTRRGGVIKEIDAHLTPDGEYYKPWEEGDKPCYFLKETEVNPENFTIDDKGKLVPIKKY